MKPLFVGTTAEGKIASLQHTFVHWLREIVQQPAKSSISVIVRQLEHNEKKLIVNDIQMSSGTSGVEKNQNIQVAQNALRTISQTINQRGNTVEEFLRDEALLDPPTVVTPISKATDSVAIEPPAKKPKASSATKPPPLQMEDEDEDDHNNPETQAAIKASMQQPRSPAQDTGAGGSTSKGTSGQSSLVTEEVITSQYQTLMDELVRIESLRAVGLTMAQQCRINSIKAVMDSLEKEVERLKKTTTSQGTNPARSSQVATSGSANASQPATSTPITIVQSAPTGATAPRPSLPLLALASPPPPSQSTHRRT